MSDDNTRQEGPAIAPAPTTGAMRKIDHTATDWTKRYAPQTIGDFVLPHSLMKQLEDFRDVRDYPPLLFHGPPGVGKTSSAIALANDTGREPHIHNCHLNGSVNDIRGFDGIFGLIQNGTVTNDPIGVIMEEACSLKLDAQMSQRGSFLENTVCPVIYTCNEVKKIIAPLRNRLIEVDFGCVLDCVEETREKALDRLCWILENEGIDHERGSVADITTAALPSMRQAIMRLQGTHWPRFRSLVTPTMTVTTASPISIAPEIAVEPEIDWVEFRDTIGAFGSSTAAAVDVHPTEENSGGLASEDLGSIPAEKVGSAASDDDADHHDNKVAGNLPVLYSPPVHGRTDSTVLDRLLNEMRQFVRRHMQLNEGAAELIVTWAFFTHVYEQFRHCPLLIILSAAEGCGKTTLLEILELLTAKGQLYADLTVAVVNRFTTGGFVTLLGDEVRERDMPKIEKGVLSGWSSSGKSPRIDAGQLVSLRTFYPKALARIGRFPREIESRGQVITLMKARPSDGLKPFDSKARAQAADLGRRMAELAVSFEGDFLDADPDIPAAFANRAADNLRPLLAIGDAAGGDWPQDLRAAALRLMDATPPDELPQVALLSDMRDTLDRLGIDRIPTDQLLEELVRLQGRPWADWKGSRLSRMNRIAQLMRLFNVVPRRINNQIRGYHRDDMATAFERFLPTEDKDSAEAAA